MYVFEGAYVDYAGKVRKRANQFLIICKKVWNWFWLGKGADIIEKILRFLIFAGSIALCVLYVRYEYANGRSFSFGMIFSILGIFFFAFLVLWGWKQPIHFLARGLSAISSLIPISLVAILALTTTLTIFIPYLVVLVILTILSFFVFVPMRFAHWLWLLHRKITYKCPYSDCSYNQMPIYICSCGVQYNDLKPSFYGIFYHVCRHDDGQKVKLWTMDFLGRKKLTRLCGGCKRELFFSSLGELPVHPIAVVGGPSTGKTLFLRQAVRQLSNYFGSIHGSTVNIDSKTQEHELQRDFNELDQGRILPKTGGDAMQAFGMTIKIPNGLKMLLYMFDAPGEHFETIERFGQKHMMQNVSGIILLIDPFTLSNTEKYTMSKAEYDRLSREAKASQTSFKKIVDVLINGVNMMLVTQPTAQCDVPLAVVINKGDALDVAIRFKNRNISSTVGLPDSICKKMLEQLDGKSCINALGQKFSTIRYFCCTTLGRNPGIQNRAPFQPVGVKEPFVWLMEKMNQSA